MLPQGVHVFLGAVALMLGDAVLRVGFIHILAHTVTGDLGQNGGRRDGHGQRIPLDDRSGRDLKIPIHVSVNQSEIGPIGLTVGGMKVINGPSHGEKVAIGLLCSTALYECLLAEDMTKLNVEAAVAAWPTAEEAALEALVTFEGTDFPLIGVKETAAKYINKRQLRRQLALLKENWHEIKAAIEAQLISFDECKRLLATVGAPTEPEDIGISRKRLKDSVMKAVRIRRRFTILDLGLRCGLLEKWCSNIFGEGGQWEIGESDTDE